MDAIQRHRSMYKGTTPPWKETYRKRCMERLKNSRSRLLEKFRQMGGEGEVSGSSKASLLVQEVMQQEWSALQTSRTLPSLWSPRQITDVSSHQEEFDELLVFDEIQQELIAQVTGKLVKALSPPELSILEDYNQSLNSCLEGMDQDGLIICPVCCRNNLTVNSRFTSCPCGLYIDTLGRNVKAEYLQKRLERVMAEHLEDCLHDPSFSMAFNIDGPPNLMISCKECDYLSVVL
ncbi:hypothetical protein DNTS_003280 [Danionella cerebrum]|uniref:RPA-interacting protein C-terminal domain-containing protein n=1 Tax=Danionella cerebrum TaxID=2873325 RepID=A0A553MVL8_9TELE|nr:hypothetical protein DNTS_003280 [Danionella translucida]